MLALLLFWVRSPKHIDLFKQVVVQVGRRWQLRLLMQVGGEKHPACRVTSCTGHDGGSISRHAISRRLVRYWADGRAWAEGQVHLSVTVDKSRVGGRGKQNGALLLPTNRCCWMLTQACRGKVGVLGASSPFGHPGGYLGVRSIVARWPSFCCSSRFRIILG